MKQKHDMHYTEGTPTCALEFGDRTVGTRAMRSLNDPETVYIRVTGRVQGVGYRLACVRQAHSLGATGWVQNNLDGSVEALVQGTIEQVDQMLAWMHVGPPAARVVDITHERRDVDRRFDRFEQL